MISLIHIAKLFDIQYKKYFIKYLFMSFEFDESSHQN